MRYTIYKLSFPNGIHIGTGNLSSTEKVIHSDTLFSAMCIEALNMGGEEELNRFVQMAKDNQLRISDAMPYIGDTMYLPKPMIRIEGTDKDSALKKEFKKLAYIPVQYMETYLSGNAEPTSLNNDFSSFGEDTLYQKVALKNNDEDNDLYSVRVYKFNENCGLYVVFATETEDAEDLIFDIMDSLQYSGIGGKRTAGYGRFECRIADIPSSLEKMLEADNCENYMTISMCMPSDDELSSVLDGAVYKLTKRSGFVQSSTYSDTQLKKRDFYMFASGAVFKKKFDGDVFDVAILKAHPIYKWDYRRGKMESYLKHYKMKLKTLAPLYIGSGKEVTKKQYIFANNKIYVVDVPKFLKFIADKNLTDKYMTFLQNDDPRIKLKDFLEKYGIRNYDDITAYVLKGVENIDNKRSLKNVSLCIKNAYNEPYIPGSSIKGMLRTVILWNMIYDTPEDDRKLQGIKKDAKHEAKTSDGRSIKRNLGRISDILEKNYLTKNIEEKDVSIMRGLIVGDSKPVSLDNIVLCQKIDVSPNGKEKTINTMRECIRPNVDIEFDLTIDSSVLGFDIETLLKYIENYSKDYYQLMMYPFKNVEEIDNSMFLGGGAGYFSKTVSYNLFKEEKDYKGIDFTRDYLRKTVVDRKGKDIHFHGNDKIISPHMQKCTRCNGKMYEMGKCQIELA